MRHISYIIVFNLIAGIFLGIFPDVLDFIIFDGLSMLFAFLVLLPFLTGTLSVLVQNEKRSYEYLPKMLITAVLNNLVLAIILSRSDMLFTFLALTAISLFGGLIGLVIRGFSLINIRNKNK